MSLFQMTGRHEGAKEGGSGRVAMWLLLPPLFVLIVLKTDFLPQVVVHTVSYAGELCYMFDYRINLGF